MLDEWVAILPDLVIPPEMIGSDVIGGAVLVSCAHLRQIPGQVLTPTASPCTPPTSSCCWSSTRGTSRGPRTGLFPGAF